MTPVRRLSAILAADVVGYSRLMAVDEEGTLTALKKVRAQVTDPRIASHNGRIVKTTGDGLLVEFSSVVDALRCAVEIQEGLAAQGADTPEERRLRVRIGINLGDVILEDDDIFGDGVNVAARLEGIAEPGGICISQGAWDLVRGHVEVPFEDMGEVTVKNLGRPIRAYGTRIDSARGPARRTADHLTPPSRSIAVLPFANMSSDLENSFFSDGVSEELINHLTRIPELRVSARTSSFAFKDKNVNVRTIARELGVRNVLEGSVRRAGKRIRITAQLIDTDSGFHLWSETYDRELDDIFAVQDEIARSIVEALELTLSPKPSRGHEKAPTTDVQAYDYYLRGRQFFHDWRGGLRPALEMFSKAIEIDPAYAHAYAGLADTYALFYLWLDRDEAHLERADAASRRALELDAELAEAHATRGHILGLRNRYEEAQQEFETAIRLDPTLYEAYYLFARSAHAQGDYEKAALMFERASAVRPDEYQAACLVNQVYRSLGKHEEMFQASQRAVKRVERHLKLNPDDARALMLGSHALWEGGDRARAEEWIQRATSLRPEDSSILYGAACFYSLAGEVKKSVQLLERSVDFGTLSREWLEHDSDLDPIRGDSRFQTLLARL